MGTADIAGVIANADWTWYTYRDHVRAEFKLPHRVETVTFAAPLTGGPVTWSVMPMRNDTENITYDTWTPAGFVVGAFRHTGQDTPDGDGYEFRHYRAEDVVPAGR